jgi:putative salt-induced outer membrane protein
MLPLTAAQADPIPERVAAMIRAAVDGGDAAVVASTVSLAKKTNPNSGDEIDALVAQLKADADRRHHAELERMGFFEGWTGQGQAGLTNSTGNTRNTGIALALSFGRDGLDWRHSFNATVDYARDNGIETKDRYFAGWETDYKFSERFYALGLASWEANRFSGFNNRTSESIGLGYSLIKTPDMTLSVQAGPALRQTDYVVGGSKNSFAAMAGANYQWTILPELVFSENVTFYGESHDSTLTSNTALTVKLIGALSAQASFLVQYESNPPFRSNPPVRAQNTDTTSRLTLVYSF